MLAAPLTRDEKERIASLRRLRLLDTGAETAFDDLADLAAELCDTPTAMISLVDTDRQWFKARVGMPLTQTPRDHSFCAHAIHGTELFVVPDTLLDPRFADSPLVTGELRVRFYAGAPLFAEDGRAVGTLCVMDERPRRLTARQKDSLRKLARQASDQLSLRHKALAQAGTLAKLGNDGGLLHELVDGSPLVFGVFGAHGENFGENFTYLYSNAAAENFFDLPTLSGQSFADCGLSEEEQARWLEQTQRAKSGRRSVRFTFQRRQNPARTLLATLHYLGPREGGQEVFAYLAEDISAYRRLELALASERERFRRAVDDANDGLWEWSAERGFEVSARWARNLGYEPDQAEKLNWLELLHPTDREAVEDHLRASFLNPRESYRIEYRFRGADGAYRWILSKGRHVLDESGRVVGMAGWLTDIQELRGAIDELRHRDQIIQQQQVKIIASAKMSSLGEMAGSIAHEVNNPLAIICMSAAQILDGHGLREPLPAMITENAERIDKTARRIHEIVKGLRAFSRDGAKDPFLRANLSTVIADTVALCRARFLAGGVELRVREDAEMPVLECRSVQISQVMLNLLCNAFDAVKNQNSAWVELSTQRTLNGARISIMDSGAGIPAAVAERMMTPFFTTKNVGDGTGLGLSIVQGLLADHGAALEYDADSAHTRFTFVIPFRQAAPHLRIG